MSETPKKVNLDAALREWPDVEKSPVELDESAQAVVTRIQAGTCGLMIASPLVRVLCSASRRITAIP